MKTNRKISPKFWFTLATACLLLAASGCKSDPPTTRTAKVAEKPAGAAPQNPAPSINLNCIFDRMQNPTEAFHYSFAHQGASASVAEEADVTPQTLDGTVNSTRDGQVFPPVQIHVASSDSDGWRAGVGNLYAAFGMPASLMMANHMSSALAREGTENVNGYDTVRYSIDTARLDAGDRSLLGTNSEKGTVWVTGPGCPVKIMMDTETQANDGSVSKDHYEETFAKK